MTQFESKKDEIGQLGTLLFIAAEKRDGFFKPESFFKNRPSSFPFLLDEKRTVTKSYGVYKAAAIDSINIARPASFVVNADGLIGFIYIGSNQTDRAPMESLIGALAQH